jgi:ABC-type branched-subunit amino acid transport system ATPase component
MRRTALDYLERFKSADLQNPPAGLLAYADNRRLEIVPGLVSEPEFLLLAEPTAGMPPEETSFLQNLKVELFSICN